MGCCFTRYTPDTWSMDRHRLMPATFRAEVRRLLPLLLKAAARTAECPLGRLDDATLMGIISVLGDMECARLAVASDASALGPLPLVLYEPLLARRGTPRPDTQWYTIGPDPIESTQASGCLEPFSKAAVQVASAGRLVAVVKKNSLPPVNWRWVEEGDGYVGRLQPHGQPLGLGFPVGCSAVVSWTGH
jgi:hypothetical protein